MTRDKWRRFFEHPVVEWAMFVVGIILLIIAGIVGPLPGPGGVFFAVPGLMLLLKSSMQARRHYVKLKRWEAQRAPKVWRWRITPGRWADMALRRRSALRRETLRKQRAEAAAAREEQREAYGVDAETQNPDQILGNADPNATAGRTEN